MKSLVSSNIKKHNRSQKIGCTKSYLKVRVLCHAQKCQKSPYFLLRKEPYSLRWDLPNWVVLQKTEIQATPSNSITAVPAAEQSLFMGRANFIFATYHHRWDRAIEHNPHPSVQWPIPADHRLKNLSLCQHTEAFLNQDSRWHDPEDHRSSRSTPFKDVPSPSYQSDPRSGFYRPYSLREAPGSNSGLQSPQTGSCVLSSSALLRSSYSRLLAWNLSIRQYSFGRRSSPIPGRMFCQDTTRDLPDTGSRRRRLLQLESCRISRRGKKRLRHRSQSYQTYPTYTQWSYLSRVQEGLGSRRVFIPATWMEGASSLHRGSQASSREARGSAYAFCSQTACLPCDCDQSRPFTGKRLAFLQWPGRDRAKYQRAKVGLSFSQDSHQEFQGERSLLSSTPSFLQRCKLVQAILSSKEVSPCYPEHHSHSAFDDTRKAGQIRQQECSQTPRRVCPSKAVSGGNAQDTKTQAFLNSADLLKSLIYSSSISTQKIQFSRFIQDNRLLAHC